MKTTLVRWIIGLQIGSMLFTGCTPTQPFYLRDKGDLAGYLTHATAIEYPDLAVESLPEATQAYEPLAVNNHDYEFLDITLEECIAYALANTKLVRAVSGSNQETGDLAAQILSTPSQQLITALDPAIVQSTTSPQPLALDGNGNRVIQRGAVRANQVGGVEDALAEFDAQYSSFLSYNQTDRARNVGAFNPFNPQQFRADDVTYQSAISKRTATGTIATVRSQTIYGENNIPVGTGRAFPEDFTQTFEFQIQQPLLRGRGALVNRVPVVLARINEDLALHQYEERVRNLVKEVELAYWDLYFAYWNVETAKIARDSSLDVWRVANAKFQAGQGQAFAEAQANAQVHQFQAQLELALAGGNVPGGDQGVFGRERELRFLMGWAATDGRLIRPIDAPTTARVEFDWYAIHGEALARNVDLRSQKWLIQQREIELISAKNQVLPELNVSALYRFLGVGSALSRRSGGNESFPGGPASAFEELMGGNYQEAAFRVEYLPPAFGARRELARVRNGQLQLARDVEVLREKENMVVYMLSKHITEMISHHEQTRLKLNQWRASELDAQSWRDKFEVGDTNLDQILDNLLRAQERRARAQQEYYRVLAEYNKSIAMIHLVKGSLLEYNNIALEEGPWAEKAYWDAKELGRQRAAGVQLPYGASRPAVFSQGEYAQFQGTAAAGTDISPLTSLSDLGPRDASAYAPPSGNDTLDAEDAEAIPAVPEPGMGQPREESPERQNVPNPQARVRPRAGGPTTGIVTQAQAPRGTMIR